MSSSATCPRCGTVALVSAQTARHTCKTCRLRFCNECVHWKTDRKQKYCARCGSTFTAPPPIMPFSVSAALLYIPIMIAIVLLAFAHLEFWHFALILILPYVLFSAAYLLLFYRKTGLVEGTRREGLIFARQTLMLIVLILVMLFLPDTQIVLVIAVSGLLVLVGMGLAAQRLDAAVVEELRANRTIWESILSMSTQDVLFLRFPDRAQLKS